MQRWAFLALAVATLAPGCHPGAYTPGVPLYPNAATTRLPPGQIAQVAGPIGTIDGKDVRGQGGLFDLLPGCHIVELDPHLTPDGFSLTSGMSWTGQFPSTVYALPMKAGARYAIRRELITGMGPVGRVDLSAREEAASGAVTDLSPAKSAEDIRACKEWETTALGR